MSIYTKTGDKGSTSLVGGTRVPKDDLRLDAYGTIDELNSWIGFIISCGVDDENVSEILVRIQNLLFDIGAILATEKTSKWKPSEITNEDVSLLENEIDRMTAALRPNNRFILPGGTLAASSAHIARTVCRRAERIIVSMPDDSCEGYFTLLEFINRLSDYLFVLARYLNHLSNMPEIYWEPREN